MFPRVSNAKPLIGHRIEVRFDNEENKIFNVSPYLETGVFKELKDKVYFNSVFVEDGTVRWTNGQDFCPDTLYLEGKSIIDNKITV